MPNLYAYARQYKRAVHQLIRNEEKQDYVTPDRQALNALLIKFLIFPNDKQFRVL